MFLNRTPLLHPYYCFSDSGPQHVSPGWLWWSPKSCPWLTLNFSHHKATRAIGPHPVTYAMYFKHLTLLLKTLRKKDHSYLLNSETHSYAFLELFHLSEISFPYSLLTLCQDSSWMREPSRNILWSLLLANWCSSLPWDIYILCLNTSFSLVKGNYLFDYLIYL